MSTHHTAVCACSVALWMIHGVTFSLLFLGFGDYVLWRKYKHPQVSLFLGRIVFLLLECRSLNVFRFCISFGGGNEFLPYQTVASVRRRHAYYLGGTGHTSLSEWTGQRGSEWMDIAMHEYKCHVTMVVTIMIVIMMMWWCLLIVTNSKSPVIQNNKGFFFIRCSWPAGLVHANVPSCLAFVTFSLEAAVDAPASDWDATNVIAQYFQVSSEKRALGCKASTWVS